MASIWKRQSLAKPQTFARQYRDTFSSLCRAFLKIVETCGTSIASTFKMKDGCSFCDVFVHNILHPPNRFLDRRQGLHAVVANFRNVFFCLFVCVYVCVCMGACVPCTLGLRGYPNYLRMPMLHSVHSMSARLMPVLDCTRPNCCAEICGSGHSNLHSVRP